MPTRLSTLMTGFVACALATTTLAAPTAPVVRDLATTAPDVALRHSGHQSAEPAGEFFGRELATGDFNGDGRQDLAVAADYNSLGGDRSAGRGRVYIYFGKGDSFPALLDPAELAADCAISGAEPFTYFGTELVAGDFDGDGKDDLAVTSLSLPDVFRGRVEIFWGVAIANNAELRVDREGFGVRISGRQNQISGFYSYFGFALTSGDFNGDGLDDLAVGAWGARGPGNSRTDGGEVTIFLGRSSWRRELVADEQTADAIIYGKSRGARFGTELAAADFNGDGRDELVAAEWGGAGPAGDRPQAGDVMVFDFSKKTGVKLPGTIKKHKVRAWDLAVKLPSARIDGPVYNARIGSSSSDGGGRSIATGDVDGDGTPDIVIGSGFVGAPAPNLKNPGIAWVVWGGSSLISGVRIDLAAPGEAATRVGVGTGGDALGDAVRVADLNGDRKAEILLGAPDADEARGYVAIYRGRVRPAAGVDLAEGPDAVVVGRRAKWRAGDDIIVMDETFAGRTLVGIGTPQGGYINEIVPRGYAGQVDFVNASTLVP